MDSTFRYGFYNSIVNNGSADRTYNAEDMSYLISGIISDGVFGSGPFAADDMHMSTTSRNENTTVSVGKGLAWFNSTWTFINQIKAVYVYGVNSELRNTGPNAGNQKCYAICLYVDKENRENRLISIQASSEVPINYERVRVPKPVVPNEFYHVLSYVYKRNGAPIIDTDIEIMVGINEGTPFVTAPLELTHIDSYFNGFQKQFDNWFNNLITSGITSQEGLAIYNMIKNNLSRTINGNFDIYTPFENVEITIPGKCEVLEIQYAVFNTTYSIPQWQYIDQYYHFNLSFDFMSPLNSENEILKRYSTCFYRVSGNAGLNTHTGDYSAVYNPVTNETKIIWYYFNTYTGNNKFRIIYRAQTKNSLPAL